MSVFAINRAKLPMRSVCSALVMIAGLIAITPCVTAARGTAAAPVDAAGMPAVTPSDMPAVTAPIALMIDVNSGRVLFSREAHRRFVPASLTKIMTSYVAFELIKAGKLRLDQTFVMRPETYHQWHRVGSTMFLENNSRTTVAQLLEGIVTVSANDACVVLAEGIAGSVPQFTAMMNVAAQNLGMHDTHYHTPNGWMDQGETYVSAADLATLSIALITRHPDLYKQFYGHETAKFNDIEQHNHNPLYGHTTGADGVKTGFTGEAGYGLVGTAQRDGRRVLMVLGGYPRSRERTNESRTFVEWAFAAWDSSVIMAAGTTVATVRVQGGTARSLELVTPRAYAIAVPHGQPLKYRLAVRVKQRLTAPIARDDEVASLIVRVPGQPIQRLPLVARRDIATGAMFDRLRDGFAAMTAPAGQP